MESYFLNGYLIVKSRFSSNDDLTDIRDLIFDTEQDTDVKDPPDMISDLDSPDTEAKKKKTAMTRDKRLPNCVIRLVILTESQPLDPARVSRSRPDVTGRPGQTTGRTGKEEKECLLRQSSGPVSE